MKTREGRLRGSAARHEPTGQREAARYVSRAGIPARRHAAGHRRTASAAGCRTERTVTEVVMAQNQDALAMQPPGPDPALNRPERLAGRWQITRRTLDCTQGNVGRGGSLA